MGKKIVNRRAANVSQKFQSHIVKLPLKKKTIEHTSTNRNLQYNHTNTKNVTPEFLITQIDIYMELRK